jgi:hypothetical protein
MFFLTIAKKILLIFELDFLFCKFIKFEQFNFLKSPLETIKVVSTYYELWIPAFAGMTPVWLKVKSPHCHSRVGGKVPKIETHAVSVHECR